MTGLLGQLFEIMELRTSVAFAERMDVVHVTNDLSGRFGEVGVTQAVKKLCLDETTVDVRHAGFNVSSELEPVSALCQLNGTKLARPLVHILKQMAVNGAKVGEVEAAPRNALPGPLHDEFAFRVVKLLRVSDAEFVSKNGRTGIEIRVFVAHSAAAAWCLARMYAKHRSCDQPSRSNISNIAT